MPVIVVTEDTADEYVDATKWHIDGDMTLHVIANPAAAGPFAMKESGAGRNVAAYASGVWQYVYSK